MYKNFSLVATMPKLLHKNIVNSQCFSAQDEDKKSTAGDGQSTEDESSQDSKGESLETESKPQEAQGKADVDVPESKPEENPEKTDEAAGQPQSSQCPSVLP